MKRILLALILTLAWTGLCWGTSPHFVGPVTATLNGDGSVSVCWKEAGLGNNVTIAYEAGATASATFNCVNGGGNCPNAANKETVNGPVDATGSFSSGKNGSIHACLTFEAPGPGGFTCPGGQTVTLSEVSFTGIFVEDLTNGISATAKPSSISATEFVCP